jgi:hypothetical protein
MLSGLEGERVSGSLESVQHQLQALRLPDPACCRDPEREVSTDGLCL